MSTTVTKEPKVQAVVRESSTASKTSAQDNATRQAVLAVVQIWLNRLALVSGISTFFASIDSLLFSLASTATHIGNPATGNWSAVDKLTTASFAGALILHVCSAIVAFVGSFLLVRLQLLDADLQEHEKGIAVAYSEPMPELKTPVHQNSVSLDSTAARPSFAGTYTTAHAQEPAWKATYDNVYGRVAIRRLLHRLEASDLKGPVDSLLDPGPPVQLLTRCSALAVIMAVLGFILAVLGILAYAWTATPLAVSVFSTACLGGCILASGIAVL